VQKGLGIVNDFSKALENYVREKIQAKRAAMKGAGVDQSSLKDIWPLNDVVVLQHQAGRAKRARITQLSESRV
jgi:hypothetical protein